MAGRLTYRGFAVAALAALGMVAGLLTSEPEVVVVGGALLLALGAWRLFSIAQATVWLGGGVEVAWLWGRAPGKDAALRAGDPFDVTVRLRLIAPAALRSGPAPAYVHVEFDGSDGIRVEDVDVRPVAGAEVEASTTGHAVASGSWHVGGLRLEIVDRLGLTLHHARVRGRRSVAVLPPQLALARRPVISAGTEQRTGAPQLLRAGQSVDLKELRPFVPGDAFRRIAWSATARTGRLMVRELEAESRGRHHAIIDIGADVRGGAVGQQPLDALITFVWAWTHARVDTGEPVGLTTMCGRVVHHFSSDGGHKQRRRLSQTLLRVRTITDEDLTEATDGDVLVRCARHVRSNSGLDFRVVTTSAHHDPRTRVRWAAGSDGAVYDAAALSAHIAREMAGTSQHYGPRASSARMRLLRRYAADQGLDLGLVGSTPASRRAGLQDALKKLLVARLPHDVLILLGSAPAWNDDLAQLLRQAHRRHHLTVVMPPANALAAPGMGALGQAGDAGLVVRELRRLGLTLQLSNLDVRGLSALTQQRHQRRGVHRPGGAIRRGGQAA